MSDQKSIVYDPKTQKTTVKRVIEEEFNHDQIKFHYESALKEKESYEKAIAHAKKVKLALMQMEQDAFLKRTMEIMFLVCDLQEKFTITQCDEVISHYRPLLERVEQKLNELKDIYKKIAEKK